MCLERIKVRSCIIKILLDYIHKGPSKIPEHVTLKNREWVIGLWGGKLEAIEQILNAMNDETNSQENDGKPVEEDIPY